MAIGTSTAMAIMAGGAALSAASAIQQGQIASKQANAQAALMQQQADRVIEIGKQDEEDYRRKASREMASRRAILGGSGVEIGSGSPLLVSEDMAGEIELQARRLRAGAGAEATNLRNQAALTRWGGQAEKRSSFVRAGASLLGGIGNAYSARGTTVGQTPGPKKPGT